MASNDEEGLLNLSTMAGMEASQVRKGEEEENQTNLFISRSLSATWMGCRSWEKLSPKRSSWQST